MGRVFLASVCAFFSFNANTLAQNGKILPPGNPRTQTPSSRGETGAEDDYQRRRRQLDERLREIEPPEPEPQARQDARLLRESLRPTPINFSLNIHLLVPHLVTSGNERKNYSSDLGAGILALYRPLGGKDPEGVQLWTGARANYYVGSGTYNGVNGRFSFGYLGPIIALGKISRGPRSVGADAFRSHANIKANLVGRHGLFVLGGIAAQTREVDAEQNKDKPDDDLTDQKIGFDSPGLWSEFMYSYIKYNAFSVNFLAGVQLGKQKTFYYIGIGTGGWY